MDVGWRNIPFRKRFWRSSHGEIEFAWGKGYITIREMESTMDGANLKDWEIGFIWRDQTCELRKTNKHSINERMTIDKPYDRRHDRNHDSEKYAISLV